MHIAAPAEPQEKIESDSLMVDKTIEEERKGDDESPAPRSHWAELRQAYQDINERRPALERLVETNRQS